MFFDDNIFAVIDSNLTVENSPHKYHEWTSQMKCYSDRNQRWLMYKVVKKYVTGVLFLDIVFIFFNE